MSDTPFFLASIDAEGGMTVRIDIDQIEGPAHAGIMLADFTQHLARALTQAGKSPDPAQAIQDMLELYAAEMSNPTDTVEEG